MYLSEILAYKKHEIEAAKAAKPVNFLIDEIKSAPSVRSFSAALKSPNHNVGLIAEVKKASPSAGVIRLDFDPIQIAREYSQAGADCLSVLTDEKSFQGHLSFLTNIRHEVELPVLRKDFVIEPYQIYEARAAGADAILLIVAALNKTELRSFLNLSNELGMDALVETHSVAEMETAVEVGADLIGINSRNLKTFITDLSIVDRVAPLAPKSAILIAESAIKTAADVLQVVKAGAHAILVGETLMRSANIGEAVGLLLD